MTAGDTEKNDHPDFAALSQADRLKLRSAAMLVTLAGIARGETEHRAWKFPLYLLFIAYMMAPIPIPGSNVIPMALAYGWYRLGLTKRARWAQGEISRKFNHAALVDDHRDYIRRDPENPGRFRVETWPLVVGANKTACHDIVAAKRIFTARLCRFFSP